MDHEQHGKGGVLSLCGILINMILGVALANERFLFFGMKKILSVSHAHVTRSVNEMFFNQSHVNAYYT